MKLEQHSETLADFEPSRDSAAHAFKEAPAEPESTKKTNSGAPNQESAITEKADSAEPSLNLAQAADQLFAAEKAQRETAAPADLRVFHPSEGWKQDRPDEKVAKKFASQAKAIFGNAPTVITVRSDPQIPEALRQSAGGGTLERPTDPVFAVQCGNGWCALILTDLSALDTIQAKSSTFATALIITWDNAWILLFFDDGPFEPSMFPPTWLKGATLARNALIPVARLDQESPLIAVVREGPIPHVRLVELCWSNGPGDTPKPAIASESLEGGGDGVKSEPSASAIQSVADLCSRFGSDRVREISPDDPRLAPNLLSATKLRAHLESPSAAGCRLVGIECGSKPKSHLGVIISNNQESHADLLTRNPRLRGGLQMTFGAAVVNCLDVIGPMPRNLTVGALTWLSDGLIPILVQADALLGVEVQAGPIPVLPFAAVQWDAATKTRFQVDEIERLFGAALMPVPKEKLVLNDLHLSELFLRQLGLAVDPNAKTFSRFRVESDSWETLSRQDVAKIVTNGLVDIARQLPDCFPTAEITRQRVERIVWLLEMRSAELPGQMSVIDLFLTEALESCPGTRTTSEECLEAYRLYCQERNLSFGSDALFYRRLAKKYGPADSHGAHRSRTGLRLRWDVICNANVTPDGNGPATGQT